MSFALRGGKGQIPRAVVSLIAGASLVHALFISLHGSSYFVLAALGTFLLTLKWQRKSCRSARRRSSTPDTALRAARKDHTRSP